MSDTTRGGNLYEIVMMVKKDEGFAEVSIEVMAYSAQDALYEAIVELNASAPDGGPALVKVLRVAPGLRSRAQLLYDQRMKTEI